jgi:hypothetical protein
MPTINVRWADNTKDLAANLKEGLNQIEATKAAADRMVASLKGDKLIAAAHTFVAAVKELGGADKLTNAERERGNALLTKAIEKYRVLGQVAPAALKDLAAATQQIKPPPQLFANLTSELRGDTLIDSAHRYVAAVHAIGGAERLSAAEKAQINAVLDKTIEKYRLLGQVAPAAMRDLAAATQQIKPPVPPPQSFANKFFGDLQSQALGIATGFVSAQAAIGLFHRGVDLAQAGVRAITETIRESIQVYAEAEAAQKKLTVALTTQGTATPEVLQQYNALATQFQKTTVFSDDLVTSMEALLVQVGGVMPSQMQAALTASTDLAAGLGVDLQTATTLVAKAAAGHTETLGKYGVKVSEVELKTKGFTAVLEAINKQFGGQAAAQIDTYAGRLEQMANAWDNVKEAIGRNIVNNPLIIKGTRDIVQGLNGADEAASKTTFTLGELLAKARDSGFSDPVLLDFLSLTATFAENAADEVNQFEAAVRNIKPPKLDIIPLDIAGPAGLALDRAIAKAKQDNAEVMKPFIEAQRQLFGTDLIERANLFIQALGGVANVTKLTAAEQERLRTLVGEGLAAYAALGRQAPSELGRVKAALDQIIFAQQSVKSSIGTGILPTGPGTAFSAEEFRNIAAGFQADGTLIDETLDSLAEHARETEEAFKALFGATAGLSLGLPAGGLPGNAGVIARARLELIAEPAQDKLNALSNVIANFGAVAQGALGEFAAGAARMFESIRNLKSAMDAFGASSFTAIGFAIQVGLAIGQLIGRFRDQIVAAFQAIGHALVSFFEAIGHGLRSIGSGIGRFFKWLIPGIATGGVVTNQGVERFVNGGLAQGTDTIPAMLSPREMVLTMPQQARLFQIADGRLHADTDRSAMMPIVHQHTHNWDLRQAVVTNEQGLDRLARAVARKNVQNIAQNKASVYTGGRAAYGLRS